MKRRAVFNPWTRRLKSPFAFCPLPAPAVTSTRAAASPAVRAAWSILANDVG